MTKAKKKVVSKIKKKLPRKKIFYSAEYDFLIICGGAVVVLLFAVLFFVY